ncbi:hypothetical protein Pmani_011832 [Petrolisthes manimaculis]|uniref:Uncharacterized protein n=1 Tax=Petrolisthes manimaculis TaxID=1843537 RepID=A0AAE1UF98_9EUCA|nr:hypothetical protein Pmani_011832 [Petrolisthes manimaculis]
MKTATTSFPFAVTETNSGHKGFISTYMFLLTSHPATSSSHLVYVQYRGGETQAGPITCQDNSLIIHSFLHPSFPLPRLVMSFSHLVPLC